MAKTKRNTKKKVVTKEVQPASQETGFRVGGLKLKRNTLLWLLPLIILLGLLYSLRGLFVAATVNGQPISRFSVIQELEKRAGKQALENKVTRILLAQEAKKRNIVVNQSDIDGEIKKIEDSLKKQGQDINQALAMQGMSRDDLTAQIEQQIILEKMLQKELNVTDKEVADYIEKNSDAFPEGTTEEEIKTSVQSQLKNEKFNTAANNLLQNLQKQAKINYFVNYQ